MLIGENLVNYTKCNIEPSTYSNMRQFFTEARLTYLDHLASTIPIVDVYGTFINEDHYYKTLNLVNLCSEEMRHIYHVLNKIIFPSLSNYNSFLDIGCGDGKLTRYIGKSFDNITAIEKEKYALDKLKNTTLMKKKSLITINDSILNISFSNLAKYDFILLSHVIYYINPIELEQLLVKLVQHLNKNGIILIIFDEGLNRQTLVENFGANCISIENTIINAIPSRILNNIGITTYYSEEVFRAKSLNTMLHITGLSLNDVRSIADRKELKYYLMENHYKENYFEINMFQKFMVIQYDQ